MCPLLNLLFIASTACKSVRRTCITAIMNISHCYNQYKNWKLRPLSRRADNFQKYCYGCIIIAIIYSGFIILCFFFIRWILGKATCRMKKTQMLTRKINILTFFSALYWWATNVPKVNTLKTCLLLTYTYRLRLR